MDIRITKIAPERMKPKPTDESQLGFGKLFTDHMFTMKYREGKGWHDAAVGPYTPVPFDLASMCFHYAQEIFEGLKAYRGKDGAIYLFRPEDNIRRMNDSAERLCMPALDVSLVMEGLKALVRIDKDWVPRSEGASLYIRPTMIATEAALGVHAANEYLFFIIIGPVGAYYPQGFSPTKIFVSKDYARATRGGLGAVKAAANYAASLYASKIAKEMGYTQVLWLDPDERKYVEEVGTSNIFFKIGDELITPPLSGTILPGITRDSVIKMAKHWGVKVSERRLSMEEIIDAQKSGDLCEAFASGTAAVVSPVGQIYYEGQEYLINQGKSGELAEKLYQGILKIQYGEAEDPFGWRMKLD